jgi:hypothetical protein
MNNEAPPFKENKDEAMISEPYNIDNQVSNATPDNANDEE